MLVTTFPGTTRSETCVDAGTRRVSVTGPIIQLLEELAQVIAALDDHQYVRKPVGVMPSSIGGHVRHSLDHVRSLLTSTKTGWLNYDDRERGTLIESSRWAALDAIQAFTGELRSLRVGAMESPLTMRMTMAADAKPLELTTTFTREAGYVLSHTIHHNAIIGAMVRTLSGWLPKSFGYAPSTIAHERSKPCAP